MQADASPPPPRTPPSPQLTPRFRGGVARGSLHTRTDGPPAEDEGRPRCGDCGAAGEASCSAGGGAGGSGERLAAACSPLEKNDPDASLQQPAGGHKAPPAPRCRPSRGGCGAEEAAEWAAVQRALADAVAVLAMLLMCMVGGFAAGLALSAVYRRR